MAILYIFVSVFIIKYIFESVLTLLNINKTLETAEIPENFRDSIDKETYDKSVKYTVRKGKFSIISNTFESVFLLLFILSGGFGIIERFTAWFELHPYINGISVIFIVTIIFYMAGLPSAVYSRFVIEKEFGFNTSTPILFFIDQIKSLVIMTVFAVPVLLIIFWFIDAYTDAWWIYAFFFVAMFQLLINFLYPVLIAPVFNKFKPLEDGELKKSLEQLSGSLDFRIKGIFTMDGSKRSRHSNAYFAGFGKYRRIVLFDTLIETLPANEIKAVLAHEIGHYKLGHLVKGIILSMSMLFVTFYIIKTGLEYEPLFKAFSFSGPSYYGIILILSLCSEPFTFFLSPLFNYMSRSHEYQADRFAVEKAAAGSDLKNALLRLSRENLSNLTPHRAYSFFHYSHPVLAERLAAIDRLAGINQSDM